MTWSGGTKNPRIWEQKQHRPYSFCHTLITPNLHVLISSAHRELASRAPSKLRTPSSPPRMLGILLWLRGTEEPRRASKPKGNNNKKKPTAAVKMSCVSFLHERNYLNWHKINLGSIFLELHRKIPHTFWQQLNISLMEFIWGLE